jgi:hypothetical protein
MGGGGCESSEMPTKSRYLPIPTHGSVIVYIHELVDRARQLASVPQLVRALHRNRRAAGHSSIADRRGDGCETH